jgi:TetR/AcrR family transcriptional repressor of mexJK operon
MNEVFEALGRSPAPLRERLVAFGIEFLSFVMQPDLVALHGVIEAEVRRYPGLAERFFAAGPLRVRAALARLLANAADRGEIEAPSPEQAAEDLVALWQGMLPVALRFGAAPAPDASEIARRVAHGAEVFLRAYGRG